jgi:hypothetical protein
VQHQFPAVQGPVTRLLSLLERVVGKKSKREARTGRPPADLALPGSLTRHPPPAVRSARPRSRRPATGSAPRRWRTCRWRPAPGPGGRTKRPVERGVDKACAGRHERRVGLLSLSWDSLGAHPNPPEVCRPSCSGLPRVFSPLLWPICRVQRAPSCKPQGTLAAFCWTGRSWSGLPAQERSRGTGTRAPVVPSWS